MDLPFYASFITAVDDKEHGFDFATQAELDAFLNFIYEYCFVDYVQFGANELPDDPEVVDAFPEPLSKAGERYTFLKSEFNGLRAWAVVDNERDGMEREHWPSEELARVRVAWLNNPERDGEELTDWETDEVIPF
jgi:hypothetical protein